MASPSSIGLTISPAPPRGGPLIVEDKVYIGDEDGDVAIFALSKTKQLIVELNCEQPIQTTPVVANDTLFINTVHQLIALKQRVMNGKWSEDVEVPPSEEAGS